MSKESHKKSQKYTEVESKDPRSLSVVVYNPPVMAVEHSPQECQ